MDAATLNRHQLVKPILFSNEATFHVAGKLNRHNVRIWRSENPHLYPEHTRGSEKLHFWCAVSCRKRNIFLDMLGNFVVLPLESLQPNIMFQRMAFHLIGDTLFATVLSKFSLIVGLVVASPYITPCDYFVWSFC